MPSLVVSEICIRHCAYGITALARYPLTNGIDIGGGHDSLTAALIGTFCWFAGFVFWASRRFTKSTGRQ